MSRNDSKSETPEKISQHSNLKTVATTSVPLSRIKVGNEDYAGRDTDDYKVDCPRVVALKDSVIVSGGITNPIRVHQVGEDYEIVGGRTRFVVLNHLAELPEYPNFTADMLVPVIVIEGDEVELLADALQDNLARSGIDEEFKFRGFCRLLDLKADPQWAKKVCSLADTTFSTYRRVHGNKVALGFVNDGSLSFTLANRMLEAALNGVEGGVGKLETHLAQRIGVIKAKIILEQDKMTQAGKTLSDRLALPKNWVPKHLADAWVEAARQGKPLPADANYKYGACVQRDPKTGVAKLFIPGIAVTIAEPEYDRLATVLDAMGKTLREVGPMFTALAASREKMLGVEVQTEGTRAALGVFGIGPDAFKHVKTAKAEDPAPKADDSAPAPLPPAQPENLDAAHARIGVEERYNPSLDAEAQDLDRSLTEDDEDAEQAPYAA